MSVGAPRHGPKGGLPGHGKRIPHRPFSKPVLRAPEGKMAPWFLKSPLSKPEYKRRRLAEVA